MSLADVQTRDQALDHLEGYSEQAENETAASQSRRPLVKSYMLETVPQDHHEPPIEEVFRRAGHSLSQLDETLFKITNGETGQTIGLLEELLPRHPAIYTYEKSSITDPWVKRLVRSSPALDNLWLSGRAFQELLNVVLRFAPGHRYGRLVFQHSNSFESAEPERSDEAEETDEEDAESAQMQDGSNEDEYVPERRSTRFMVIDKLDVLNSKLQGMQDLYSPLHAISQLRFPAKGRGGHDFYHFGKATNNSDSFRDHRLHLKFVLRIYKKATETTERTAWQGTEKVRMRSGQHQQVLIGAPVLLEFGEPLSQATFDNFIASTFSRKVNKFRLWGNPIKLGPRKVHVYGLDRHLWQPLFLEITDSRIVVIVPQGTCGNSIHRLVTNVQQYLDPGVKVWIGDKEYASLIRVEPDVRSIYDEDA